MWEGTLENWHFWLITLVAAGLAYVIKIATKVITSAHHPLILVLVTQVMAFVMGLIIITAYLGYQRVHDEITSISFKHWGLLTGITLGAMLSLVSTVRLLKTEKISKHSISHITLDLGLAVIGGMIFFEESMTLVKATGMGILLLGAYLATS